MKNGCYRKYYDFEKKFLKEEKYYLNDELHREDGPARIDYGKNGNIRHEEYYLNGWRHREDGCASISYHENGEIKSIGYYLNGIFHREAGPARINYLPNGNICSEIYFYKNKLIKVKSLEEYLEYVESEKLKEYLK